MQIKNDIYFIEYQRDKSLKSIIRSCFRKTYFGACKPLCKAYEIRITDFVSTGF